VYKEEKGNLLVPKIFKVPEGGPWPKETWGMKLGLAVTNIRSRNNYLKSGSGPERRAWLEGIGFLWQARAVQWEIAKTALGVYNEEKGNLLVPKIFKVPEGSPWPKETWGMKLGEAVHQIRSRNQYLKSGSGPERRAWLEGIGFLWQARARGSAVQVPVSENSRKRAVPWHDE
jgi:hypothetical protein